MSEPTKVKESAHTAFCEDCGMFIVGHMSDIESERDHLRERVAELTDALRPFAEREFSRELGGNIEGPNSIVYQRNNVALTIGHFRRALAALTPVDR